MRFDALSAMECAIRWHVTLAGKAEYLGPGTDCLKSVPFPLSPPSPHLAASRLPTGMPTKNCRLCLRKMEAGFREAEITDPEDGYTRFV